MSSSQSVALEPAASASPGKCKFQCKFSVISKMSIPKTYSKPAESEALGWGPAFGFWKSPQVILGPTQRSRTSFPSVQPLREQRGLIFVEWVGNLKPERCLSEHAGNGTRAQAFRQPGFKPFLPAFPRCLGWSDLAGAWLTSCRHDRRWAECLHALCPRALLIALTLRVAMDTVLHSRWSSRRSPRELGSPLSGQPGGVEVTLL